MGASKRQYNIFTLKKFVSSLGVIKIDRMNDWTKNKKI